MKGVQALAAIVLSGTALMAFASENEPGSSPMMGHEGMQEQAAAQRAVGEALKLKDGSYLFISDDGTMRMVDADGKPMTMRDDVEMELEDGSIVVMENGMPRRHDHRATKN